MDILTLLNITKTIKDINIIYVHTLFNVLVLMLLVLLYGICLPRRFRPNFRVQTRSLSALSQLHIKHKQPDAPDSKSTLPVHSAHQYTVLHRHHRRHYKRTDSNTSHPFLAFTLAHLLLCASMGGVWTS
jgi:hypothetical protein